MSELEVSDLVQQTVDGHYDIPEFQREFVWKPSQVAELADSLSRGYPIGCLIVWSANNSESKMPIYIVDGQQRITALCIMFGKRPNWKDNKEWDILIATYSPYLNVSSEGKVSFGRKKGEWASLSVKEILSKSTREEFDTLVSEKLDSTSSVTSLTRTILYEKANQIWNIKSCCKLPLVSINVQDPLEVAEMYNRLNTAGTRIRETDTQLAFIAVKNPGWVKTVFRNFIQTFEFQTQGRWSFSPGFLLRGMAILYSNTPRVADIKNRDEFWTSGCKTSFEELKNAIADVIPRLERYGVMGIDDIPSDYNLIAFLCFCAHFSRDRDFDFDDLFKWFLSASIGGQYGGGLERLSADASLIMKSNNPQESLKSMAIPKDELIRALDEEFEEPFKRKSPGALLLKVLLWRKAIDWKKGGPLSGYPPLEWHHIISKKIMKDLAVDEDIANNVANITLLSADTNKQFKDDPPWKYASTVVQDPVRLQSHFIPQTYAESFVAGKPLFRRNDLAKLLSERLKEIKKQARDLLIQ